jgi:hypothetical protein
MFLFFCGTQEPLAIVEKCVDYNLLWLLVAYAFQVCQRSHWLAHREACWKWTEIARVNGGTSLASTKKMMAHFTWLLRGFQPYIEDLFDIYGEYKVQSEIGCIDFEFCTLDDLRQAVATMQSLPIVGHREFNPPPFTPTYRTNQAGCVILQNLPLRSMSKTCLPAFLLLVHGHMHFKRSGYNNNLPNMQHCVELLGDNLNTFMVSISVNLPMSQTTHTYDVIYC